MGADRRVRPYVPEPGIVESEFDVDLRTTLRTLLGGTAEAVVIRDGEGFLDQFTCPDPLPDWLDDEDIDAAVESLGRSGFTGGLNWYRNIDRSWELLAPWRGRPITPPALYLCGDEDLTPAFSDTSLMAEAATDLRGVAEIPGAGHWVQMERPDEVNAALLDFLKQL